MSKKETDEFKTKESFLNSFFRLRESNSSIITEFIAGLTAGFVVLFTLITSSNLLSNVVGSDQPLFFGVFLLIGLAVAGVFSIVAGFYTKLPIVFSSSLGFTSFLTLSLISVLSLGWNVAIAFFVIESVVFIVVAYTSVGKWIINEMPSFMNLAAPLALGGILIFFSLLGGKFISFKGDSQIVSFTLRNPETFVFVVGIIITFILHKVGAKGSLLYGMALTTLLGMFLPKVSGFNLRQAAFILAGIIVGWLLLYAFLVDARKKYAIELSLGVVIVAMIIILIFFKHPDAIIIPPSKLAGTDGIFALPDFKNIPLVLSKPILSLSDMFAKFGQLFIPLISLLFTHIVMMIALIKSIWLFFDEEEIFSSKEKDVLNGRLLVTEGTGSLVAGSFGSSPVSSSFGTLISLVSGGKTGLTSVFTGIIMILSMFIIPLGSKIFTPYTVAPALFVVGLTLISKSFQLHNADLKDNIVPLLFTGIIAAFTMNIFQGIAAGLLIYVIIKLLNGKYGEINAFTWILLILFIIISFYRINIPFLSLG